MDEMKGKIFKLIYKDDRDVVKSKWIIFEQQDAYLLWYKNPIHELRVENVRLEDIQRMEEKEFDDLWEYMTEKDLNTEKNREEILKVLEVEL